ncbi:MAG: hypothetical protein V1932_05860 [Chloroflexota bacterium]
MVRGSRTAQNGGSGSIGRAAHHFFILKLCHLANINSRKMYQWKQQTEAVQAAIDELRTCFVNIVAAVESLDAELPGERESSRRGLVQEIIHVAKGTEGKLSQLYQVCKLLAGSSTGDDNW